MALPRRLSERERQAILHAKMVEWEWQAEKRRRHRDDSAARRRLKLRRPKDSLPAQ